MEDPGGTSPTKASGKKKDFQMLCLSETFISSMGQFHQDEAWVALLNNITNASCVEDQMDVIKTISSYIMRIDSEVSTNINVNFVSLAVDLYLSAPLKHPAKCALTKTFNTSRQHNLETIQSCLKMGLESLLKSSKVLKDPTASDMTLVMSALLGCYESLRIGPAILESLFLDLMHFVDNSLKLCWSFLSSWNTPVLKVEVGKVAHTLSRIVIFALQQTNTATLEVSDCGIAVAGSISKTAVLMMSSSEVSLDTRTNFGFVNVLIVDCLEGPNGWMQLIGTDETASADDELSLLCVCSGLLSGLSSNHFELVHSTRQKVIYACLLDIILLVNEQSIQDSNVVLALWRVVQQWTRVLLLNPKLLSCLDACKVTDLLNHIWSLPDHYMDTVRHLGRGILENIMHLKDNFLSFGINLGDNMAKAVLLTPQSKRSRYVILSIMTVHLDTSQIIAKIPTVIHDLLTAMQLPTMSSHVSGAFVGMSTTDFKKLSYSKWCEIWVMPLLDVMQNSTMSDAPALEEALSKTIKLCPAVINEILPDINQKKNVDLPKLKVLLTCMKIGRKLGVLSPKDSRDESLWLGTLPYHLVEATLCHECDEIRLSALALIVETNRSTEMFCQTDFMLVKLFLEHNVNCEIPSFRQQSLACMCKLLNRVKGSAHVLTRSSLQSKGEGFKASKSLQIYKEFVIWLVSFCFENIKIGSNYSRRLFSLKLLTLIFDIMKHDSLLTNGECQNEMWSESNALTLLGVILVDTYEENKAMATNILILFPDNTLALNQDNKLFKLFQSGCFLASSIHPSDCISAAYLLELCCRLNLKISHKNIDVPRNNTHSLKVCDAIALLKAKIETEASVAQHDILQAASSGPMYGSLSCIRHLLSLVPDFSKLEDRASWQKLIADLVNLCFKLSKIVSPVVNSSSPEGHVPMDFNQGSPLMESSSSSPTIPLKVTAQMVLLCSWRTVKEVSLLLGKLCDRCPIIPDDFGLLSEEQICAIGLHLTTLLEETKHRGAFEQAYVGFSLLAARLWRHQKDSIHELPQKWLNELVDAIQNNDSTASKLCATRRSAGVPFLVQALVSAEPLTGAGLQSLQWTMSQLLACAADKGRHVECRTHALNILRAMYRHAPLAEHIGPYIAKGVVVAISGFRGKTWAERNSATLLFSSLMTRIFGVQRSREELSSRNKMTGRIFFHRYPELYEFLLVELKQAVTALTSQDVANLAILHPILLLIARLYPASSEGTDMPMQLNTFVPLVRRCASNSVLKTRVLAAKAVVPLITANVFVQYVSDLVQQTVITKSQNLAHGLALQIACLLSYSSTLSDDGTLTLESHLKDWILRLLIHLNTFCSNPLSEVLLQIFEVIASSWFSCVPFSVWKTVEEMIMDKILFINSASNLNIQQWLGQSILEGRATRVLLLLLILGQEGDSEAVIVSLLKHSHCVVVEETLAALERLLGKNSQEMTADLEDLIPDVTGGEKHWSERLPEKITSAFCKSLSRSQYLGQIIASLAMRRNGLERRLALRVLVHIDPSFWSSKVDLQQLLQLCYSPYEAISCAGFACFSSVLKYLVQSNLQDKIPQEYEDGCKLVKLFCADDKGVMSRMAAVNFLLVHRHSLEHKHPTLSEDIVSELWICALKLISDDDSGVRSRAALLCQVEFPLIPRKSSKILLEELNVVLENSPSRCLATLLVIALGPLPDSSSFVIDEERVFEKGETNMFIEHETLTDFTIVYISRSVLKGTSLSTSECRWVWANIGGVYTESITDIQSLFGCIRQHNSSGISFDSGLLLPIPVVCSLHRLHKVEVIFTKKTMMKPCRCFPFDPDKLFGSM